MQDVQKEWKPQMNNGETRAISREWLQWNKGQMIKTGQ